MSDELKPCPFCGGAVVRDYVSCDHATEISCSECDLCLWWHNDDWNKRAETPEARALKEAKATFSRMTGDADPLGRIARKALQRIEAIERGEA